MNTVEYWKQRAEAAEAALKEAQEQEPLKWETSSELMDIIKNPIYARPVPAPAVPAEWRGKWKHTKGEKYRVLMLANEAATDPRYPLTVVYQGQDGNIWTRPAHDWDRSMTLLKSAKGKHD